MRQAARAHESWFGRPEIWGAALIALIGAWLVLAPGCADVRARGLPEQAIAARPQHPVARVALAEQAFARGDDALARSHALEVLASAPINGPALRVLAAIEERSGDRARAGDLMNAALRRSPRDVPALYWLAFDALAGQDLSLAVTRFDRLLRVEPAKGPDVQPLLLLISGHPRGWPALARALADAPPWRDDFMRRSLGVLPDGATATRWMRVAAENGLDFSSDERAMLLRGMMARREWEFVRRHMAAEGHDLTRLRDGGFDEGRGDGLRGWHLGAAKGIDARLADSRLSLEFLGLRAPFRHLHQTLLLDPGPWRFTGQIRMARFETGLGLRWVLACLDPAQPIAADTPRKGESGWERFSWEFVVPEDCRAQELRLELASRIAADLQARGLVEIDELGLDRP